MKFPSLKILIDQYQPIDGIFCSSTSTFESDIETPTSRKRRIKKKKHAEFDYGLENTSTDAGNEDINKEPLSLKRKNVTDSSHSPALKWPQLTDCVSEPETMRRKRNSSGDEEILHHDSRDIDASDNEAVPADTSIHSQPVSASTSQFLSKKKRGVTSTPRRPERHQVQTILEDIDASDNEAVPADTSIHSQPVSASTSQFLSKKRRGVTSSQRRSERHQLETTLEEIMKKILICVRTILEIVDENQAYLVRQDVGKRQQSQSSTQNFEYLIKKPATTVDELKGIDQKLEEEGAKNAAVSYLSLVGGQTVTATIRGVLDKIATKFLLAQYSKDGQKGKHRFKDYEMIYSLLISICRKTHSRVTEKDIEADISAVLKSYPHYIKKKSSRPQNGRTGRTTSEELAVDEE